VGLSTPGKILGRFISSGGPLREWAAPAPLHTDDNALLEFSAPRHLYRGQSIQIAKALFERHHSPFGHILIANAEDPQHEAVQAQAASVSRARHLLIEAQELRQQRQYAPTLRALLQAYQLDPGDPQIYHQLVYLRQLIKTKAPESARSLVFQPLLAKIDTLRVPTIGSPKGSTMADLVRMLEAQAKQALQRQQWALATDYLTEASTLEPDNTEVIRRLALALAQAGYIGEATRQLDTFLARHPANGHLNYLRAQLAAQADDLDTALARLEAALDSGQIPIEQVNADKALDPIRNQRRFQALQDRYMRDRSKTPRSR